MATAAVESRALTVALRFRPSRMAAAVSSGRKRMIAAELMEEKENGFRIQGSGRVL
jgi:hypothetical protein